jgi:hypothetical protein
MSLSHHRLTPLAAALAFWTLVSTGTPCRAQSSVSQESSDATHPQNPHPAGALLQKNTPSTPPVPGQLVNGSGTRTVVERPKRVPPILIAFVLLFLITWVRSFWERRRLRAQFRQSCESPPQSYI